MTALLCRPYEFAHIAHPQIQSRGFLTGVVFDWLRCRFWGKWFTDKIWLKPVVKLTEQHGCFVFFYPSPFPSLMGKKTIYNPIAQSKQKPLLKIKKVTRYFSVKKYQAAHVTRREIYTEILTYFFNPFCPKKRWKKLRSILKYNVYFHSEIIREFIHESIRDYFLIFKLQNRLWWNYVR